MLRDDHLTKTEYDAIIEKMRRDVEHRRTLARERDKPSIAQPVPRDLVGMGLALYARGAPVGDVISRFREATEARTALLAEVPLDLDEWSAFDEVTFVIPAATVSGGLETLERAFAPPDPRTLLARRGGVLLAVALELFASLAGRPLRSHAIEPRKLKACGALKWTPMTELLPALAARDAGKTTAALAALLDKDWKPWVNASAKARTGYIGRFNLLAAAVAHALGTGLDLPARLAPYFPAELVSARGPDGDA